MVNRFCIALYCWMAGAGALALDIELALIMMCAYMDADVNFYSSVNKQTSILTDYDNTPL